MIEIDNLTNFSLDKNFFEKIIKIIFQKEQKKVRALSITFVKEKEIEKLNTRYRKKRKGTDVLSFRLSLPGKPLLGQIVICPKIVRDNAKKLKTSFKEELLRVLIHGVLHLLGYDHEKSQEEAKKMEKKQEFYLNLIKR
jgi:probable rRNA maturation factor